MAQIPNLDNSPLSLTALREQSQKELLTILKNIRGKKLLVLDPKLSGSLALIIQTSLLKEHGVELRHLSTEPIQTDCKNILYLVRSQINLAKLISSHIQHDLSKGLQREYFVSFVPRRTVVCEKIFEEEKVHQMLTIGDYPLYIIPMDEDVLSFELDLAYRECQVDGDASSLWHVAKAIHKLESSFGVIPNVRAKGKASTRVADILNRMQGEEPINSSDVGVPEINTLILLDREVDMVTPMFSQLTYEGLLDEFLRVNNGSVELDASIMGVQQDKKKIKVPLNSSLIYWKLKKLASISMPSAEAENRKMALELIQDAGKETSTGVKVKLVSCMFTSYAPGTVLTHDCDKLYKEIRDLNFEVVGQVLRQKATSMKQDYTEVTTTTQTVSELKDFVKRLNSLPEMTRHINLAQHLSTFTSKPTFLGRLDIEHLIVEGQSYDICFEYIEEMIHKQEPIVNVLRLLVLFSITNSGLPKKHFDYLRRELLHSYGFEHMATLNNLEKAGLLKKQDSKSNWLTIKRALQLVVDDTDTANPNDISYVFSGYAPLSIRLIQHAVRSGWRPIEEILKLLPGPHLESKRGGYSNISSLDTQQDTPSGLDKMVDGRRSLVLVIFIGGVTFAEISALRFLSAQEGMAYDLIVGTTKIVNGHTLLETLIDCVN